MMNTYQAKRIGLIIILVFTLHFGLVYCLQLDKKKSLNQTMTTKVIVNTVKLINEPSKLEKLVEIQPLSFQSAPPASLANVEIPNENHKEKEEKTIEKKDLNPTAPQKKDPPKIEKVKSPSPTSVSVNKPAVVKDNKPPKKIPESTATKQKPSEKLTKEPQPIKKPDIKSSKVVEKSKTPLDTKNTTTKPSSVVKKNQESKSGLSKEEQELLKSIQENIAAVDNNKKTTKEASYASISNQAINLKIDQNSHFLSQKNIVAMEASYKDELIRRLKLLLKMPELGEVKMRLTINREGRITQLTILHSDSEKNRLYVEKNLPSMTMPVFGDRFKENTQYTFPVTLSNE